MAAVALKPRYRGGKPALLREGVAGVLEGEVAALSADNLADAFRHPRGVIRLISGGRVARFQVIGADGVILFVGLDGMAVEEIAPSLVDDDDLPCGVQHAYMRGNGVEDGLGKPLTVAQPPFHRLPAGGVLGPFDGAVALSTRHCRCPQPRSRSSYHVVIASHRRSNSGGAVFRSTSGTGLCVRKPAPAGDPREPASGSPTAGHCSPEAPRRLTRSAILDRLTGAFPLPLLMADGMRLSLIRGRAVSFGPTRYAAPHRTTFPVRRPA